MECRVVSPITTPSWDVSRRPVLEMMQNAVLLYSSCDPFSLPPSGAIPFCWIVHVSDFFSLVNYFMVLIFFSENMVDLCIRL